MKTFAGGAFGGVWWGSYQNVSNCIVRRSLISASSISNEAFSGGLVGLLHVSHLSNSLVLASVVTAEASSGDAYAGGLIAKDDILGDLRSTIVSCSSSARVAALGRTSGNSHIAGIGCKNYINDYEFIDNYFVNARANTNKLWYNTWGGNDNESHNIGNLHLSDDASGEMANSITIKVGDKPRVYPHLSTVKKIRTGMDEETQTPIEQILPSAMHLGVSDPTVADLEIVNAEGNAVIINGVAASGYEDYVLNGTEIYRLNAKKAGITYVYAYTTLDVPAVTATGAIENQRLNFILCSYPVNVEEGGVSVADNNFQGLTYKRDNGTEFTKSTETNTTALKEIKDYTVGEGENAKTTTYSYFTMNVGQNDTVFNRINIFPDSANQSFLTGFKLYKVNLKDTTIAAGLDAIVSTNYTTIEDYYAARINYILQNKTTTDLGDLNGKISVMYDFTNGNINKLSLKAYQVLRYHEILVAVYDAETVHERHVNDDGSVTYTDTGKTCGVIIEFRPNEVTGMTITPSNSTPALDTVLIKDAAGNVTETQYVFAPGDTIRFDSVFERVYPTYGHYAVKVEFSGVSETVIDSAGNEQITSYDANNQPGWIRPNGTVNIPQTGYSYKYTIKCRSLDYNISKNITILIKKSVNFEYDLSGADVVSDRKFLDDIYFNFTSSPHPGYGMQPTIAITALQNGSEILSLTEPDKIVWGKPGADGKGTITLNGLTYTDAEGQTQTCTITYTKGARESDTEYNYEFYMPKETVMALFALFGDGANEQNSTIKFSITYIKTYYLAFISDYGANENQFFMVPVGHVVGNGYDLDSESIDGVDYRPLRTWIESLDRPGYDMNGFYMVRSADSRSGYGTSFEEMRGTDETKKEMVNGALRFYARWAYKITVAAPKGVTVESGLPTYMRQDDYSLVPLDDDRGFSFVIKTPTNWEGTPRFSVYVMKNREEQTGETSADGTPVTKKVMYREEITQFFKPSDVVNGYEIDPEKLSELCSDFGFIYLNIYADSLDFYVGDGIVHDTDRMYADGVFTLEYSLNRLDATYGDITFNFDHKLPEKTSLRLYYRKNGTTVWSGGIVLGSQANVVKLSQFTAMNGLGNMDRSGIASEKFILVITLPNNCENFDFTGTDVLDGIVSVAGYYFTPQLERHYTTITPVSTSADALVYKKETVTDTDSGTSTEVYEFIDPVPVNSETVKMYKPLLRNVVFDEATKNVTFSIAAEITGKPDDLIDYRHKSSQYIWSVEKIGGGVADLSTFTPPSSWTKTADTVLGAYYIAGVGTFDISSLPVGYKLTLLEVTNSRQPSEGLALYEISHNADGTWTKEKVLKIMPTPTVTGGGTETPTT